MIGHILYGPTYMKSLEVLLVATPSGKDTAVLYRNWKEKIATARLESHYNLQRMTWVSGISHRIPAAPCIFLSHTPYYLATRIVYPLLCMHCDALG